jgi:hypothetical protein
VIYVHRANRSLHVGDHHHEAPAIEPGERVWGISCSHECEERILADVEHAGRGADSVPLTPMEVTAEETATKVGQQNLGELIQALRVLATQRDGMLTGAGLPSPS